jgi:hypothetical protein
MHYIGCTEKKKQKAKSLFVGRFFMARGNVHYAFFIMHDKVVSLPRVLYFAQAKCFFPPVITNYR